MQANEAYYVLLLLVVGTKITASSVIAFLLYSLIRSSNYRATADGNP